MDGDLSNRPSKMELIWWLEIFFGNFDLINGFENELKDKKFPQKRLSKLNLAILALIHFYIRKNH